MSVKEEENQDQYLKAKTTITLTHVCGYTCMLNINISIVGSYGLKLNLQNYTPKGPGAHSVEKQELSGLNACLCVL